MNDRLLFMLTLFAALGCGLIAGLFFTFSVFVMKALGRLPPAQGIAAMQSINVAIITPLFFLAFLGTALACVALTVVSFFKLDEAEGVYLLVGSLLYLVGVMLVTIAYHLPRNDSLATIDPHSEGAASHWARYVKQWTMGNHVRALASLAGLGLLIMAIRVG